MSTGCECDFVCVAATPHPIWFYVLEDYHAPKNSWDWREYASAYGPFDSEDEAFDHLHANHANPGGSSSDYEPRESVDGVLADLIKNATR